MNKPAHVYSRDIPALHEARSALPGGTLSPVVILLCDHNEEEANLCRRALGAVKFENRVHHVRDGKAARLFLKGRDSAREGGPFPVPHLVLLEWEMPSLGGRMLAGWIRAQRELDRTCLVTLHASERSEEMEAAYLAGANGCLMKPPGFGDLLAVLNLVAHHRARWLGPRLHEFGVGRSIRMSSPAYACTGA